MNLPKSCFDSPLELINPETTFFDFCQLSELINQFWVGEIEDFKQKSSDFVEYLNHSHLLRIISYMFIEQYRINHHVQLS